MDKEKARQKEARRTLNRIRGTLNSVHQDAKHSRAVEDTQEYRHMKDLLEHGYAHNKPGPLKQFLILIKHPVFAVFVIILLLMLIVK